MTRQSVPPQDEPALSGTGQLGPIGDRPSRTKEIYEQLRLAIARRELVPGNLYSVAELAATFGVSRTPVREALIDLSARGIIQFERNRGVRITQSSAQDLKNIFELRLILETHAASVVASRLDPATESALTTALEQLQRATTTQDDLTYWSSDRSFHRVLLEACGNELLSSIVDNLRDSILVRGTTSAGRTRTLQDITNDHEEILTAVLSRRPAAAAEAMRAHLQRTADSLLQQERDGDQS
ncbi:GntR family transcriptional regulator [Jiangella sp. DSM 45060]|uniref:GntR family transcriptional regulator n=1 Tax=Jiangella sp. DSM 45060 TaxID=1798224 RepID=UPI0008794B3D|nr:GntR family transcriptional regulator [Jiangella sp. DSM 45060]SDT17028.1 DNA-binding transcriptional regulator, GntR family [Jiangella sp. DSM 45060]